MGEEHFLHIEYFRIPPRADVELAAAPREFLRKVMWILSGEANYFEVFKHPPETSYIDAMSEPPPLPWPWLSEVERAKSAAWCWPKGSPRRGAFGCNSDGDWTIAAC